MKILIADDSRAMRMIVMRTLRQAGLGTNTLVEAANGREALTLIDQEHPDLVLSDWNMPEMTGIELLRALRGRGDDVPGLFVTSEGSVEMRETAEQAGALGLVTKPFTAEMFEDVLSPVVTA
jgi:two-component system chemotaxis response regulator CheY